MRGWGGGKRGGIISMARGEMTGDVMICVEICLAIYREAGFPIAGIYKAALWMLQWSYVTTSSSRSSPRRIGLGRRL